MHNQFIHPVRPCTARFAAGFARVFLQNRLPLSPNLAQAQQYLIVSNTATTVTVWADWATIDLGWTWFISGMSYQVYDYHLQPGSPCIDAGDNSYPPRDVMDLDAGDWVTDPVRGDME